jgi:hypothetical protein
MTLSLNQLRNMSFSNVLSYFSSCSKSITSLTKHSNELVKTLFSLNAIKAVALFPKDFFSLFKEFRDFDRKSGLKENIKDAFGSATDLMFDNHNGIVELGREIGK